MNTQPRFESIEEHGAQTISHMAQYLFIRSTIVLACIRAWKPEWWKLNVSRFIIIIEAEDILYRHLKTDHNNSAWVMFQRRKSRQLRYWYLLLYYHYQVPDVKRVTLITTKIRDEWSNNFTLFPRQIFEQRNPSHSNIAVKVYVILQRLKSRQ